jgi:hypothetical protein
MELVVARYPAEGVAYTQQQASAEGWTIVF